LWPDRRVLSEEDISMTKAARSAGVALFLGLATALAAAPVEAEDAVLVSSSVARYIPGTVITDDQILTLPPEASAVLLFRSGSILRLKGPFEGKLQTARPAGAPGGIEGLVNALRGQGATVSVVGATRGFVVPSARAAMADGLVNIDAQSSAIYCIGANDTLWLRGYSGMSGTIQLRRGHRQREVAWPKGAGRIPWPADVLIDDGDRFDIVDNAGKVAATMIFRRFKSPSSATAWIAAGLLSGCRSQMGLAFRELAVEIEKNATD
jgi:hypothetical protein